MFLLSLFTIFQSNLFIEKKLLDMYKFENRQYYKYKTSKIFEEKLKCSNPYIFEISKVYDIGLHKHRDYIISELVERTQLICLMFLLSTVKTCSCGLSNTFLLVVH